MLVKNAPLCVFPVIFLVFVWIVVCSRADGSGIKTKVASGIVRGKEQTTSRKGNRNKDHHQEEYEKRVTEILNNAEERMQQIYARKQEIFYSLTQGHSYDSNHRGSFMQDIDDDYHQLSFELAGNLSEISIVKVRDPIQKRQIERLCKLQLHGLDANDYKESRKLLQIMQNFVTDRTICMDDCTQMLPLQPNIFSHIVRTKSLHDLDYFWLQWRQQLADHDQLAKSSFIDYVRLWRKAAAANGHITPSRTWYLYYETENFQKELENVMWELMPLYKELHAFLRHSARMAYGEEITGAKGAIPVTIYEQMLLQAWYPRSTFRTPYPKNLLPTVKQKLEEVLGNSVQINKKAAEFFESLGLNEMSEAFYEKFTRRINDDELDLDCKSEVMYFPPDVGLRYCPKLDYKLLLQMHSHMAELQFNIYKKELPFGLDTEACPGFATAIGEAAVVAAGSPRHLNRLHILNNSTLSEEKSMNRLFRMGIHTLLALPQYMVNELFLADVMDGRIASHEYNCAYWRLQYKYGGIVPPTHRTEKHFDPDYRFYRGLAPEKSNTMKFITEILGFQLYRAFCLNSREYKPTNPQYPLHNCDFYGSKTAGDTIKKVMKLGATKHWREIMYLATGEKNLSAKGLLEYFAPLYIWLKDENKRLNLHIGWDDSIKCGNT